TALATAPGFKAPGRAAGEITAVGIHQQPRECTVLADAVGTEAAAPVRGIDPGLVHAVRSAPAPVSMPPAAPATEVMESSAAVSAPSRSGKSPTCTCSPAPAAAARCR